MVHYFEKLTGVVVFAKVQGQVNFESPRALRVCGLSNFASPNILNYPRIYTIVYHSKSLPSVLCSEILVFWQNVDY